MQALNTLGKHTARYVYNDCTAFLLISANAIYTIAVGLTMMTHGGLLKHVSWKDEHFRRIVYWGLTDIMMTAAVRLLYCSKGKKTALKIAFLMVALLPVEPMFCAFAGHLIIKDQNVKFAAYFITIAIMSLALNILLSSVASAQAIKMRIRANREFELQKEELAEI